MEDDEYDLVIRLVEALERIADNLDAIAAASKQTEKRARKKVSA